MSLLALYEKAWSVSSALQESLFGHIPPDGACAVRFRLRLKLSGNPPALTIRTLTEEAVLGEIHRSTTYLRWLVRDNGGKPLSDEPRTCAGEITWLGSDGKEIDAALPVEFTYWPEQPAAPAASEASSTATAIAKGISDGIAAVAGSMERLAARSVDKIDRLDKLDKLVDAHIKLCERVDTMAARECERSDTLTRDLVEALQGSATPDKPSSGFGLGFLRDLIGVASDAKKLVN